MQDSTAARNGNNADWRVGLFFHTLHPPDHPDEHWRGRPKEQGRVVAAVGDGAYEVTFYSWLLGDPLGSEVKPLSFFDGANWYPNEEEWVRAAAHGLGDAEEVSVETWRNLKKGDRESAPPALRTVLPAQARRKSPDPRARSKRLRFKIFMRDGFKCRYCGRAPPEVTLHLDHIVPIAKGGADDETNLAAACEACNLGKHADRLT